MCKLLMSFCVVGIHTLSIKNPLIRECYFATFFMAVPFFFLTSGFLLAKKMESPSCSDNQIVLKSYLRRFVKWYLIWNVVYLPLAIYYFFNLDIGLLKSLIEYIKVYIFSGDQWCSWQLWYLLSTIYTLILMIVYFRNNFSIKHIVILGSLLFLFGIGLSFLARYDGNLPNSIQLFRKLVRRTIVTGRIFSGMFYLPFGFFLYKTKINNGIYWLLLMAGIFLNIMINSFVLSEILVCISSIGLFGVVKSITLPDSSFYPFARRMSIIIYFIHMYVYFFFYEVLDRKSGYKVFLWTLLISIAISIMCIMIHDRCFKRAK